MSELKKTFSSRLVPPLRAEATGSRILWRLLACASGLVALGNGGAMAPVLAEERVPIDIEADQLEHFEINREVVAVGRVKIVKGTEFELETDRAVYHVDTDVIETFGNGRLINHRDKWKLRGDRLRFHTQTHQFDAEGNIVMEEKKDHYFGDQMTFFPSEHRGTLTNGKLDMDGPGGRGSAETVVMVDHATTLLKNATYTNCDCVDPPWKIISPEVTLNQDENEATAIDATLELLGQPVAYSPWFRHPIKKVRKSGFLTPSARVSGSNGLELDLPYYWNIAPNQDATVTVHPTWRRGILGKVQFRYLEPNYRGEFDNYSIYDTLEGRYRGLTVMDHRQWLDDWLIRGRVEHLESRDFLRDFNNPLLKRGTTNLESSMNLSRLWRSDGGFSQVRSGASWFQYIVKPNDNLTWQRLPYLVAEDSRRLDPADSRLRFNTRAQFDSFLLQTGETAQRLDVSPTARFRQLVPIGEVSAALGVRNTSYLLNGNDFAAYQNNGEVINQFSSLASMRLDSRLHRDYAFGDRPMGWSGWRHTIEPTVQWVSNQGSRGRAVPWLDSGEREFSITNLFAENRLFGVDQQGSGQWVSYGMTSRMIGRRAQDGSVREMATFAIGQRWSPQGDREWQENRALSDVVTGLDLHLDDPWTLGLEGRYNPYRGSFPYESMSVTYQTPSRDSYRVGYHVNRTAGSEDVNLTSNLHLEEGWSWQQELDYSLSGDYLSHWQTGVTYNHECWSLNLFAKNDVVDRNSDHGGTTVGFLLNLQGLGEYGLKP